jgi:hypothetical protein
MTDVRQPSQKVDCWMGLVTRAWRGCLSLGVDLEGAARGARKELSRRGKSAWRQRLAGESRQQRLLWVWVLAGCWAARKVVADGG